MEHQLKQNQTKPIYLNTQAALLQCVLGHNLTWIHKLPGGVQTVRSINELKFQLVTGGHFPAISTLWVLKTGMDPP